MSLPYLVGYTDRLSVRPGEDLDVMLGSDRDRVATVDLVRSVAGDGDGHLDPDDEDVVASFGEVEVAPQHTVLGSCIRVPGAEALAESGPIILTVAVMPTLLGRRQSVMAQNAPGEGWWLGLTPEGHPALRVAGHGRSVEVVGEHALVVGAWYALTAGSTGGSEISVSAVPLPDGPAWRTARSGHVVASSARSDGPPPVFVAAPIHIGAAADGTSWHECFDGKIEAPTIGTGRLGNDPDPAPLVAWDLGVGPAADGNRTTTSVPASGRMSEGLDGECLNAPLRAVTGHRWTGREQDHRLDHQGYGAIHFHSDDLDDCRWSRSLSVAMPAGLDSDAYALRVRSGDLVDRLPVFVRPSNPRAPVVVLIPTASYLTYANDHPGSDGDMAQAVAGATPVLQATDMLLHEHREWGLSCYDLHADGSGVAHTTRLRPMLNMRSTHRYHVGPWQLPADIALVGWLRGSGIPFDVICDDDLDREGITCLEPYRVVVTGTHPEYYSTAMLDAVESWVDAGGRLMYLGANGFYWRIAYDPDRPWLIELRRGSAGSRAWESEPGEHHLAATGERGGLWRHLGRTPQRLTGVGYAAQGFDSCAHYRRLPDSRDARAAYVFEGVSGDTFGTAGRIGGGAAGQEVDRYDTELGTPTDALLLATSEGLSDGYLRCVEELGFTIPGTSAMYDSRVRADVVYHVRPGGGAVFATGSIAWAGSLGVDPDIDTITRNVLTRFSDPAPLDW